MGCLKQGNRKIVHSLNFAHPLLILICKGIIFKVLDTFSSDKCLLSVQCISNGLKRSWFYMTSFVFQVPGMNSWVCYIFIIETFLLLPFRIWFFIVVTHTATYSSENPVVLPLLSYIDFLLVSFITCSSSAMARF